MKDVIRAFAGATILMIALSGCGSSKSVDATQGSSPTTVAVAAPGEPKDDANATTTIAVRPGDVPDPCKVLTADDITGLVHHPVTAGKPSGTGESCNFAGADPAAEATVLLSVVGDDNHEKFVDARKSATVDGVQPREVSGAGDEAFLFESQATTLFSAEARKGTLRVRVVVSGAGATDGGAVNVLNAAVARI